MKILITGAGGFVGSRLAEYYGKKYDVWTPSHHEFDFTDQEAARAGIAGYQPDVVLHCAAISDVGTCEKNPELSQKVNVEGTVNLAVCCAEAGIKLVYCSSDQVYVRSRYEDESAEEYLTPWKEEDGKDPKPLYGKHKLTAEQICQKICPSSVGLRLTWMYGTLNEKETTAGRRNMEVILRNKDMLAGMDCFVCNEIEAGRLFEDNYADLTNDWILHVLEEKAPALGVKSIVVTTGSKGAVWYDCEAGEGGFREAFASEVRDTSGAGDSFFAGLVFALTRGYSLQAAVDIGSLFAARTIEHMGPVRPDLGKFILEGSAV